MKKDKMLIILTISAGLFLLSFSLGYQLVMNKSEDNKLAKIENTKEKIKEEDLEIIKEEEKISPNTIIEQRILYKECGDLIVTSQTPSTDIVNMTKEEYANYLANGKLALRVVSFSSNKVVIWGERDHLCNKHFIISEEDGKIAVFKIDDNGEKVIHKIFVDYPVELLMELDRDEIKRGIRVDSEEELSDVLENFIS